MDTLRYLYSQTGKHEQESKHDSASFNKIPPTFYNLSHDSSQCIQYRYDMQWSQTSNNV